ncbi:HAMP domain-containing protein [Komarekiella sp. 'clone 1']|uniref:histidine kinase n=1 Tax=Komarekiella delphini-convector SJRDD-AB1 TaxID=2593771 RepID=A0AA40VSN6_9NOST|nr:ATP-binding protein [Komarekiella delphini-convector]MBD6618344.1 HAMP domain-containing protein [Komarekiella delphini-convector SJRDD-AB1]
MIQKPGQSWLSSLVKGVPLSRVLVVPFLLQISLTVGLTIYLSLYNGQIDRNTQTIIWFCLAAFGLSALLGIITARWIAQLIIGLNTAAKTLANGTTSADFINAEDSVIVQGIDELEGLAGSFNQMVQQLRESFATVATAREDLELRTQELQQEIQQRIQNERRLGQHSRALAELANHRAVSDGNWETAFKVITETAANALEVERVSVWVYNGDRTKLQCVNLYERSKQRFTAGMELKRVDYPIYFKALATACTIIVTDTRNDLRVKELRANLLEPQNIVSLIATPIWVGGEVVGMVFHEQVGTPRQWELIEQNFVGSIADFVVLTLEICDRIRAESALREAKEVAEVANRAKNTFLANISHELQTPLNSILAIAAALQNEVSGPLKEEQHQSLNTLELNAKQLLQLINNILDFAKIESGKIELQLAPTSIQELCDSSLSFVKQQAFKKNIRLSSQVPEGLEPIQVDEYRIRQMLVNLLNNAVKFTLDNGEIWIEVQPNSTNEYIFISVVDTGIGISSDDLSKLFQPFVHIDNAYTRRQAGTGLGLAMVQRIVQLHGGSVHAESALGRGSRFTVKLPWSRGLGIGD